MAFSSLPPPPSPSFLSRPASVTPIPDPSAAPAPAPLPKGIIAPPPGVVRVASAPSAPPPGQEGLPLASLPPAPLTPPRWEAIQPDAAPSAGVRDTRPASVPAFDAASRAANVTGDAAAGAAPAAAAAPPATTVAAGPRALQQQPGLCYGHASTLTNVLCIPCVLPYNAFSIYCGPCLYSYLSSCATSCFCGLCAAGYCGCVESWWRFTDTVFPPDSMSLGPPTKGVSQAELARIGWARSDAILAALRKNPGGWKETSVAAVAAAAAGKALPRHMPLFCGKIEPRDIAQGGLGDCWLMCALACLSEFPAAINKLFVTKSYAFNGRYVVRLWRQMTRKWEIVVVDDFFPVSADGTPLYAKPNGSELWVMVSEQGAHVLSEETCLYIMLVFPVCSFVSLRASTLTPLPAVASPRPRPSAPREGVRQVLRWLWCGERRDAGITPSHVVSGSGPPPTVVSDAPF